jgi:hypothetical protein
MFSNLLIAVWPDPLLFVANPFASKPLQVSASLCKPLQASLCRFSEALAVQLSSQLLAANQ